MFGHMYRSIKLSIDLEVHNIAIRKNPISVGTMWIDNDPITSIQQKIVFHLSNSKGLEGLKLIWQMQNKIRKAIRTLDHLGLTTTEARIGHISSEVSHPLFITF